MLRLCLTEPSGTMAQSRPAFVPLLNESYGRPLTLGFLFIL